MNNQVRALKQTELCGRQFNVYGSPEEPLFLARDVASFIEHSNTSKMLDSVDDDEKTTLTISYNGNMTTNQLFVTEDGLYEVLMLSRKPIAKQFKKGVKTILKEIRTSGGYIATKQDDTPEEIMARALIVAQQTIDKHKQLLDAANQQNQQLQGENELLQSENHTLAPKAAYTDEVLQSTSTFTLTQVAHSLGLKSVHVLTDLLSKRGILYRQSGQWQPSAKVASKGYFSTRTAKFIRSDNSIGSSISTVVTEIGRAYLHTLLCS